MRFLMAWRRLMTAHSCHAVITWNSLYLAQSESLATPFLVMVAKL